MTSRDRPDQIGEMGKQRQRGELLVGSDLVGDDVGDQLVGNGNLSALAQEKSDELVLTVVAIDIEDLAARHDGDLGAGIRDRAQRKHEE